MASPYSGVITSSVVVFDSKGVFIAPFLVLTNSLERKTARIPSLCPHIHPLERDSEKQLLQVDPSSPASWLRIPLVSFRPAQARLCPRSQERGDEQKERGDGT